MRHGRLSWTARAAGRLRRAWWSLVLPFGRLPLVRAVRGRQFRRMTPLAGGRLRGTPIVRYYWDRFLGQHRGDVRGECLEVGSTDTIRRLAPDAQGVAIDLAPRAGVSIVADLCRADHLAPATYDCVIVPFTMHLIYDVDAALHHAIRLLKPGGILLVNFPCIDYDFAGGLDMGTGAPMFMHWWFTPLQVHNLLRRAGLEAGDYSLEVDGNLTARLAYQINLPAEELTSSERDHRDPGHPLLISVRVRRPERWCAPRPAYRDPWLPATTPARWNARTGHYPEA